MGHFLRLHEKAAWMGSDMPGYHQRRASVITESLRQVIETVSALPPEAQDRVAAAMRVVLEQSPVPSDAVRREVMVAFEQVMEHSTEVLDYLRDK
jgi:hypothetical protein